MPTMSVEEHKAAARRYVDELYNKGNLAIVDELMAPNFVYHTARPPFTPDREGMIQQTTLMRSAFPDLHISVDDLLIEGDMGAMRWTMRGTHEGEFLGVPPTHKHVTWSGLILWRIRDGKETESWNFGDDLGLFQQFGVFPQVAAGQQPFAPQPQPPM